MSDYTYNAPPCDLSFCTNLCLKEAEKGTRIADIRKVWGRQAPIVKCHGRLFLMAHDDFKRLSGRFAGGDKESEYWS